MTEIYLLFVLTLKSVFVAQYFQECPRFILMKKYAGLPINSLSLTLPFSVTYFLYVMQ